MNYQSATRLRCFMFTLGAVFAATPEEAEQFATRHGMWNRLADGSWGRGASDAHAELCADQIAAYRHLARVESYRCPCCGDDVIGTLPVCKDCRDAGCEQTTDAGGDLDWHDCQREDGDDS